MRILLAPDESKGSEQALEKVALQFRTEKAEVRILHVLQGFHRKCHRGTHPSCKILQNQQKALLERAAKSLSDAGFKTETILRKGEVREAILDSTQEWNADLIVLGSHSRGSAQRFLLGSVAESVARHAPCSVEVVRSSNGPCRSSLRENEAAVAGRN